MKRSLNTLLAICLISIAGFAGAYSYASGVTVNGQALSKADVNALEQTLGTSVTPGNYLYNAQNGCWSNLSNGTSGCLGSSGTVFSRYGSGERNSRGDWSHWSNYGGGVGGTGDGCIYTANWSNC